MFKQQMLPAANSIEGEEHGSGNLLAALLMVDVGDVLDSHLLLGLHTHQEVIILIGLQGLGPAPADALGGAGRQRRNPPRQIILPLPLPCCTLVPQP